MLEDQKPIPSTIIDPPLYLSYFRIYVFENETISP